MSSSMDLDVHRQYVAYLRVSSLVVSTYDWLYTLPIEWQIFGEQVSPIRLSRPCILLVLIRYTSISTLIFSNITYFKHIHSFHVCQWLMYAIPVMKALQTAISQLILSARTWAISGRSNAVFWVLAAALVISVTLEVWSNVYKRAVILDANGNCSSGNESHVEVTWVHYLVCMTFDLLCLIVATAYLVLDNSGVGGVDGLAVVLLREGLVDFAALTAINLVNLVLHRAQEMWKQSAAVSFGITFTWITTQRILIHLHELRLQGHPSFNVSCSGTIPRWNVNAEINSEDPTRSAHCPRSILEDPILSFTAAPEDGAEVVNAHHLT